MNTCRTLTTLAAGLLILAACESDRVETSDPGQPPPTSTDYTVTITEVVVVNKDSGEPVIVEGLPVAGGSLEHD